MTDHLLEAALAALCTDHGEKVDRYDVARAVGYIRDHLQQADPDPLDEANHADRYDRDGARWWWCDACCGFRAAVHTVHGRGYSWPAAEIDQAVGPLTFARRPEPEPEPDPLDETNHADRYDRDGEPWEWCDDCGGFVVQGHGAHNPAFGRPASKINQRYGPLTFAPRPAEPPATAPQPAQAHGDAVEPARPELNVQTALADAWDDGHRTGRQDERNACYCEAWNDNECGCGNYGNSTTLNPYRKARA